MKDILSNLRASPRKSRKRRGRGQAAGQGTTGGRGTKGQLSRTGSKKRPYFEGGQIPFVRRIPKRGFNNPCRTNYEIINVKELEKFKAGTVIDHDFLKKEYKLHRNFLIKILGDGKLTTSLTVKAHKFSKSAKEKIEAAGGKIEIVRSKKQEVRSGKQGVGREKSYVSKD
ncbi:50S ribosomal protein L15 [candidate division WOR-3 bacterium]|nr:50S ribosomal protein L15 [candidate division WOR-3 bacterium]